MLLIMQDAQQQGGSLFPCPFLRRAETITIKHVMLSDGAFARARACRQHQPGRDLPDPARDLHGRHGPGHLLPVRRGRGPHLRHLPARVGAF